MPDHTPFTRYALFYVPPAGDDWTHFATQWLGWDCVAGQSTPHPAIPGLPMPVAEITRTPRRYGLHATLKPPFQLAQGHSQDDLETACATLARSLSPLHPGVLQLHRMGRFLALQPTGPTGALNQLAATCLRDLDRFRAPPTPGETARRRPETLTPRQQENLRQWGYPYVMNDFRFHITLTGRLPKSALAPIASALNQQLAPLLPQRFTLTDLALMGEAGDGHFRLLHRYQL